MGGQFFSTTYYDWHGLMPLAFPSGQSISILIYFFFFFSLLFKQACLQEIEVRMLVAGWYTPIAIPGQSLGSGINGFSFFGLNQQDAAEENATSQT